MRGNIYSVCTVGCTDTDYISIGIGAHVTIYSDIVHAGSFIGQHGGN